MDITALNAFISVARHASFSKASEQLYLTQPAVSKRVAALEEELGTKLFNRVGRQVSLSDTGRQLLPKAIEIVQQAADLQRFASTLNDQVSGTLSIAIAHHIGLHRMPPILQKFGQEFSDVSLDIRFEDSEQALIAVEQGDIEFAIITLPNRLPKQLSKQSIWEDELSVVVGRQHPLAEQCNIDLRQLSEHSAVLPGQDTETFKIMQRTMRKAKLPMLVQMETNNLETLKMLCAAGLGWSLLPKTMLDSSLVPVLPTLQLSRTLGLIQHQRRSLSAAALAFKTLLMN